MQIDPIATVHSCFTEKFGIPRQPNLVPSSQATIELLPPYNVPEAVEGLERSSHIWVQFVFHENRRKDWKPKVRPPRLGGNSTMGVFATRSPIRPNPLGLSVVRLEAIDLSLGVRLLVSGHDFLDGTPVVDIKPYVPYSDAIPEAQNDFASKPPSKLHVHFSARANKALSDLQAEFASLKCLIEEVLSQDPRPAYHTFDPDRVYGMTLCDKNIQWRYVESGLQPSQTKTALFLEGKNNINLPNSLKCQSLSEGQMMYSIVVTNIA